MSDRDGIGGFVQSGLAAFRAGRMEDAEEQFRRVLIADASSGDAHHMLGVIAMERRRREMSFDHFRKALELAPESAKFHNSIGVAYVRDRRFASAMHHFWQAIALKPDYLDALKNLTIALQDIGEPREVLRIAERALQLDARAAEVLFTRARALQSLGRNDEAVAAFEETLSHHPNHSPALTELGFTQLDAEEYDTAQVYFERALEKAGDNVRAWNGLGHAFEQQGAMDQAIATWERALERAPQAPAVLTSLGIACVQIGRSEEGRAHLTRAIEVAPENSEAHLAMSQAGRFSDDDPEIVRLESLVRRDAMPDEDRSRLHFALGKAYEDTKRFEEAFAQYQEGNRLKRGLVVYEPEQIRLQMRTLKTFFTAERLRQAGSSFGSVSELPVFVVGMPRSGTTLVEQIIASHPAAFGAGELPAVEKIIARLPQLAATATSFPFCLEQSSPNDVAAVADEHVQSLQRMAPYADRVVDKMPKNAFYIGLIRMLWPQARIVLCHRDPLDVAMSCYTRYFAKGQPFSWSLPELGEYMVEHEELMKHWRGVVTDNLFEVRYEELTEAQEDVTRNLIDFVGLDWDERCLEFHKTDRRIKTNPLAVRKPIYRSSVKRWKRFEPWIGALQAALGGAGSSRGSGGGEHRCGETEH